MAVLLALTASAEEGSAGGILEHLAHTLASLGRTLQVVLCSNLLRDSHALATAIRIPSRPELVRTTHLFRRHRALAGLPKLLNHTGVTSEVLLASNENDGQASAEVHHLGDPLLPSQQKGAPTTSGRDIPFPGRYQASRASLQRSK